VRAGLCAELLAHSLGGVPGPLLVVDAPSILYRSYFAMPSDIVGADGAPVGAVLGFVRFVMTEIDACVDPVAGGAGPRAVVICFGAEEASYRVELLPQYHAHRDPMPDDLRVQFEQAAEVCALLGWRVAQHSTLEADGAQAAIRGILGQQVHGATDGVAFQIGGNGLVQLDGAQQV